MMLEILPDDLDRGRVVAGRYELQHIVGEGGMAVVWAARHMLTDKPCALKFLKGQRAADPKSHDRLLREARAACAVRHPNVAQVHDILELESGVPFIVMDLLEGEALSARLRRKGALSVAETCRIVKAVVEAVAAAHALGLVHRDLKPDNVFLERRTNGEDVVKVLDFGIAKFAGRAVRPPRDDGYAVEAEVGERTALDAALSRSDVSTFSVMGTPVYMAPEQLAGGAPVDARADIWAIGVLTFECLVGHRPRPRAEPGAPMKANEVAQKASPSIVGQLRGVRVPERVSAMVARMLCEDPRGRPSLATVHHELETSLVPSQERRRRAVYGGMLAAVACLAGVGLVARSVGAGASESGRVIDANASRPSGEPKGEVAPKPSARAESAAVASFDASAHVIPSAASSAETAPILLSPLPGPRRLRPAAPSAEPSAEPRAPAPPRPSATSTPEHEKIPTYDRE